MVNLPISFIEVRVLAHSTENPDKVYTALTNILGKEIFDKVEFKKENLQGHHGNPITLIKTRIYSKSQARKILENIFLKLDKQNREQVLMEVKDRVDEDGNFYLRLDKQAAYLGKIKLFEVDPIHIQVRLAIPRKQKEKIVEVFRESIRKVECKN